MDDVHNNHNHKYFAGNRLSKTAPFIRSHRLLYNNYQIAIANSTFITVARIIYFTALLCVYVYNSAISFLHKAIVHKLVFIPLG